MSSGSASRALPAARDSRMSARLQFIPRYGEAMKLAIEMAALQTALGESYYQMNQLQSEVAQNAAELQQAVGRHSGVADGAESERAPVHAGHDPNSDRPQSPLAVRLDADNAPGPPAG